MLLQILLLLVHRVNVYSQEQCCDETRFVSSVCPFRATVETSQKVSSVGPHLARMDFTRARCGPDLGQNYVTVWDGGDFRVRGPAV